MKTPFFFSGLFLLICMVSTAQHQHYDLRTTRIHWNIKAPSTYHYFKQIWAQGIPFSTSKKNINITVSIDTTQADYFTIHFDKNKISFKADSPKNVRIAFRYFVSRYLGFLPYINQKSQAKRPFLFSIPKTKTINKTIDFNYREVYFPPAFSKAFRVWNSSEYLENKWGLWGHNISRKINLTDNDYALIDGKRDQRQLDFSSKDLYDKLHRYIAKSLQKNPQANYFMIMPKDNLLSCTCKTCLALGNSSKNASPALFTLINKLAVDFPTTVIFGAGYKSSSQPPDFNLKKNTGVIISTYGTALGQPFKKNQPLLRQLQNWKSYTDQIYIWDYAVNFNAYFEVLPVNYVFSVNRQQYVAQKVRGFFIQGNETGYSAFSGLKSFLLAQQLLYKLDTTELKEIGTTYMMNKYPVTGKILADYYFKLEQNQLTKKHPLSIYGKWQQALYAYQSVDNLKALIDKLNSLQAYTRAYERGELRKILLALYFEQIEFMRVQGFSKYGYATLDQNTGKRHINETVPDLLSNINRLSTLTGITTYNESQDTIDHYLSAWDKYILSPNYHSILSTKNIRVLSKKDVDYTNTAPLTDGAIGFKNDLNNWWLSSYKDVNIKIRLSANTKTAYQLKIGFLSDHEKNISPPISIEVFDKKNHLIATKTPKADTINRKINYILPFTSADNAVRLYFTHDPDFPIIAIDEIQLVYEK